MRNTEIKDYEKLAGMVQERLRREKPEVVVHCETVQKNNGMQIGISMKIPGKAVTPCIYPDAYITPNADMNVLADILAEELKAAFTEEGRYNEMLKEGFKPENLFASVVNYERNSKMLETTPHDRLLDLAIIYRVKIRDDRTQAFASCIVTDKNIGNLGVSPEELKQKAVINTRKIMKPIVSPMSGFTGNTDTVKMYVLTNQNLRYGAAAMCDNALLDATSEYFGGDFFILPSSIHEVIAVPCKGFDPADLQDMVKAINRSEVSEDEFLSDSVYRYNGKTRTVEIAI